MTAQTTTDIVPALDLGAPPGDHPPKVLLVDDRPDNLFALEAQLRGLTADFLKATSGKEALDVLLEHQVAVAIIDVQIPEMDGLELAEIMRSSLRTRAIPIVFISAGLHDSSRVFKGYEAGAVDFLIKPVESRVLTGKIAVFLQLHRQRQALAERIRQLEAAERAKQESERRFQTMAENIVQLAWMARPDGLTEILARVPPGRPSISRSSTG